MSTCFYPMGKNVDTRVAVFARKLRPGESEFVDTSKATYNTAELRFTEQARRMGSNWKGRIWDEKTYLK
jgi:sortase B